MLKKNDEATLPAISATFLPSSNEEQVQPKMKKKEVKNK